MYNGNVSLPSQQNVKVRDVYKLLYDYVNSGIPQNRTRRNARKMAANTYVKKISSETIAIEYYGSDVVIVTLKTMMLNSCDFKTYTTKERINWIINRIGFSLWQHKREWYITKQYPVNWQELPEAILRFRVPFFDGMRLPQDFRVTKKSKVVAKQNEKMKKLLDDYLKGLRKALLEKKIGDPGPGDCLLCRMVTADTSHIISHLKEKYYVPTMIYYAMRGQDKAFCWLYFYGAWRDGKSHHHDINRIIQDVRIFLKKKLNIPY